MGKKQNAMEAILLWAMGGLFTLPFIYCLHGARRDDIYVGAIGRHPYVEGHLHGEPAWFVTACAFALCAAFLAIAAAGSLSMLFAPVGKKTRLTKVLGWTITVSLLVVACAGVAGPAVVYMAAKPMP
jgi:hypothetical protein